jgi:hypothetical protein
VSVASPLSPNELRRKAKKTEEIARIIPNTRPRWGQKRAQHHNLESPDARKDGSENKAQSAFPSQRSKSLREGGLHQNRPFDPACYLCACDLQSHSCD